MAAEEIEVTAVFLQEFYEQMGVFEMRVRLPRGARLRDLVEEIERRRPGFRDAVVEGDSIRYPVEVMVNGRRAEFLDGLDTVLRDGDRVVFSPRALFVV